LRHILSVWNLKFNLFSLSIIFSILFSCTSAPGTAIEKRSNRKKQETELSETQEKLLEGANWALGKTKLTVNGKRFNLDCSGTVMAVYYYAGIDLSKDFEKYRGGGTARIYQYLDDNALIYDTEMPVPGDIIFWDNTYDSNGDGVRNDKLTHMGMVVDVSEEGTITYLHEHYRKGIIMESMNLRKPDNLKMNSAMRMRGSGMEEGWLASHLYRDSAMGYKLEN
jgi:hypothetical protein